MAQHFFFTYFSIPTYSSPACLRKTNKTKYLGTNLTETKFLYVQFITNKISN